MIAILDLYGFRQAIFIHKFQEKLDWLIPEPKRLGEIDPESMMPTLDGAKKITFVFDRQIEDGVFIYRYEGSI